jgi:hypothetical protein
VPHLEPVSGVPDGEEPTSGVAAAAADPPVAATTPPAPAPSTEDSPGTFAGPTAPTAGAPFPNQPFAWSYPPLTRRLNNMALASMIVSLASFLTCPLLGLLGVYLGTRARNEIKARGDDGDGMALAGIVAGWVATGLSVLLVAFYAIVAGAVVGAVILDRSRY